MRRSTIARSQTTTKHCTVRTALDRYPQRKANDFREVRWVFPTAAMPLSHIVGLTAVAEIEASI